MRSPETTLVIPTLGRASLGTLLDALAGSTTTVDCPVVLVDDRPRPTDDLAARLEQTRAALPGLRVLRSGGGGPARARNLGWRHARTEWVSFLDDDVLPGPDWYAGLLADLAAVGPEVAGVAGRVSVPLPEHRPPTDWERSTAGLAMATWITADMSYRRSALVAVGGFDERFRRAYREDADLGLRITDSQGAIVNGSRCIEHPVRPADDLASLRQQAGNADDALMRRLHGSQWRERAHVPAGRRPRHLAITASAALATLATLTGHRRIGTLAALAWAAGTGELAWARIAPGPRDAAEVRRMVLTSVAIPFAASYHWLRGGWQHRDATPWRGVPDLVLVDRDGTIVYDEPYNGDPSLVVPVEGAREALDRLRAEGIRLGVVTNQSGVGSGRITRDQVDAVNARVEDLLGPFDVWQVCPHARDEGCECRKPAPGLVARACEQLGVAPERCVVVGDIGSDVDAARAAGAAAIMVPTPVTRPQEIRRADLVAEDLADAVDRVLGVVP